SPPQLPPGARASRDQPSGFSQSLWRTRTARTGGRAQADPEAVPPSAREGPDPSGSTTSIGTWHPMLATGLDDPARIGMSPERWALPRGQLSPVRERMSLA